jgi:predicted AAA+ superfamily ATPase
MFKRRHLNILKNRLLENRKFIQVIAGPRQVGKTTLILQLIKEEKFNIHYISADNVSNAGEEWVKQQWELVRIKISSSHETEQIIAIDEIQKINNWSEIVKKFWDDDTFNNRNIKLILLGSSQMLMQKGLSESLAGRFEIIFMNQWRFTEMNEAFGFDENQYLYFGGYPGSAGLINDEQRWKDYILNSLIETTLFKDILLMTRIDKPELLRRLFELGSSYSGQIVSYSKILGQLDDAGNSTTLSNYLSLLDRGGLLKGIDKYSKIKIRQRASSPKWQVKDNSFLSVMSNKTFKQVLNDNSLFGRFVESLIGVNLLNDSVDGNYKVYYWRDGIFEVDFIIEKQDKIIALEVKSNYQKKAKGIREFSKRFNPDKSFIIGEEGIKWNEFIKINPIELF